jgi:protein-S-isoprenylcysteine O-methyltransferase Ste14
MSNFLFALGAIGGTTLLALLVITLVHRPLRIWPTPGPGAWQNYVFWPLFRGLNIACFAVAGFDRSAALGVPLWLRVLAALVLIGAVGLFVYSFLRLGRDNSYGATDGLVTSGIYQWTRNPQNAMLMVVYGSLAFAADSGRVALLCAVMVAVYGVMVLAEEPWLDAAYGAAYRTYCARVPRFFNWRRLFNWRRVLGGDH